VASLGRRHSTDERAVADDEEGPDGAGEEDGATQRMARSSMGRAPFAGAEAAAAGAGAGWVAPRDEEETPENPFASTPAAAVVVGRRGRGA
jgi:hypothetical protein